jgi:hypothetical protein
MGVGSLALTYLSTPLTHPSFVRHAHGAPGGPGRSARHQFSGVTQMLPRGASLGCAEADGNSGVTQTTASANWRLKKIMTTHLLVANRPGHGRRHQPQRSSAFPGSGLAMNHRPEPASHGGSF